MSSVSTSSVFGFFFFFFDQRLLHYSWDMNSANREMNSIFDVNSNLKIIFLLFSVFSKRSCIQTHLKWNYSSLWFLSFIEPCGVYLQGRTWCTQVLYLIKYNIILFEGSSHFIHLLYIVYLLFLISCSTNIYIYIYLCCGVHLVHRLVRITAHGGHNEPSPVQPIPINLIWWPWIPLSTLGLGIVKRETHKRLSFIVINKHHPLQRLWPLSCLVIMQNKGGLNGHKGLSWPKWSF